MNEVDAAHVKRVTVWCKPLRAPDLDYQAIGDCADEGTALDFIARHVAEQPQRMCAHQIVPCFLAGTHPTMRTPTLREQLQLLADFQRNAAGQKDAAS